MHSHPVICAIDGALLLATSLMLLALVLREYHDDYLPLRAALYATAFFALCSALHLFGMHWPQLAWPYWARVAFDASIMCAVASRLFYNHFVPRPAVVRAQAPTAFGFIFFGPTGEYATMLNLKPGQTGTAIFTFQDNTQTPPVGYPLAAPAVLSVDDATKVTVTMTKDGTADGIVTGTVALVEGATPGSFNIKCVGQGAADGSDEIDGTLAGAVLAPEDNSVVARSTVP